MILHQQNNEQVNYKVWIDEEKEMEADAIIIATGASAKWLGLESEQRLNGSGVSACAVFTIDDLKDIQKRFDAISSGNKIILTTEKDAVRLVKFENELANMPLYVVPIELEFLFNDAQKFNGLVTNFIKEFKKQ